MRRRTLLDRWSPVLIISLYGLLLCWLLADRPWIAMFVVLFICTWNMEFAYEATKRVFSTEIP